jgi:hypothetical protein
MFWRLKNRLHRTVYQSQCRRVFQTPPLRTRDAPLTFVSMCSHDDLTMYLLALKSLYRQIGEGRVVVLNDGSLTQRDRDILTRHIVGARVENAADVDTVACPRGGMWERLLRILELAADSYVIQVDADTLTRDKIAEVVDCYRGNRAFTLGVSAEHKIVSLEEASLAREGDMSTHVQTLAERTLARIPSSTPLRYVCACAGFAGFPRGLNARESVHEFSRAMVGAMGEKWSEWGSEQVTSNYVVANAPGAIVLPFPKYASFDASIDVAQSAFVHFIGICRYRRNVYAREGLRMIRELNDRRELSLNQSAECDS